MSHKILIGLSASKLPIAAAIKLEGGYENKLLPLVV